MATAAPSRPLHVNEITGAVVSSAMKVHSLLGPGLLESAYEACLAHELRNRGFHVGTQVALPVVYEGHKLEAGYRIDLVVAHQVVVEVKSAEAIHPISQSTVALLPAPQRNASGPADQFQCPPSAGWYQPHGGRS